MSKKKKQHHISKKHPAMFLIGVLIILSLTFAGINVPNEWYAFLGLSEPTAETINQPPLSKEGDNPGPIEHGEARFTAEELALSSSGWITYGSLDNLGRPTAANALITKQMINTGTSAQQDIRPPGFVSGLDPHNHSRGHLIGRQLGGTGDDLINLVTLYQNPVNTPYMTKYENMVRKAVDNGDVVRYRVTPIYHNEDPMPISVEMDGKGLTQGSDINFFVTIENKK